MELGNPEGIGDLGKKAKAVGAEAWLEWLCYSQQKWGFTGAERRSEVAAQVRGIFFFYLMVLLFVLGHACTVSRFSHLRLFVTLWTVAHQAPLSMVFPRQEYWSGLPCPSPGESSRLRNRTHISSISCIDSGFFTIKHCLGSPCFRTGNSKAYVAEKMV